MNEYNFNVKFEKGRISSNLKKLVQNDYNSTKINFTFDREGRKLFKMLYPDGTSYITQINNNELIFGPGVLSQDGTYEVEIAVYTEDGRLTDYATTKFEVRAELIQSDKIVEIDDRVPILDGLINEVNEAMDRIENIQPGSGSGTGGTGENGATFTPSVSEDGIISWTNDKGLTNPASVNIKGPQGPQGIQGETGPRGEQGPQGIQGPKGDTGSKGPQGDTGPQGSTGRAATISIGTVTTGASGTQAEVINVGTENDAVLNFVIPQGPKGADGSGSGGGGTGENGATFTPTVSSNGVISWSNDKGLTNPTPVNIRGPQGIQGEQGPAGKDGDKGDKGDTGEQGPQGEKGVQGEIGPVGPKGDAGNEGPMGPQGPAGNDGAKGDKGDKGDTGEQGPRGEKGQDGYTPVKGKDYFTEADKQEMVSLVLAAIPSAEGVGF